MARSPPLANWGIPNLELPETKEKLFCTKHILQIQFPYLHHTYALIYVSIYCWVYDSKPASFSASLLFSALFAWMHTSTTIASSSSVTPRTIISLPLVDMCMPLDFFGWAAEEVAEAVEDEVLVLVMVERVVGVEVI